jgi:signal transduction histidine kinase
LRRSIGIPLTVGIAACVVAVALAVGWPFVVFADLGSLARGLTPVQIVLLVLGGLFSALLIAGLVLLCAWLVREWRINQRQTAFMDAVSHEMKTPLASLRLYLDTLVRHDPSPERRAQFVGRMREDLGRLQATVEQVLAAGRAEARAAQPRREPVDLAALIPRCVEEIRARHPDSEFELALDGAAVVRGEPADLELVFRNLLENAVKYSEGPARVSVRGFSKGESRVSIEIADRGIGIPRAELRKIFDRFYRAGRDVQRNAGLGLGLFIVRSLVRRQGGRVVAESEGAGRGSRFVVTLPAVRGAEVEALRAAAQAEREGAR